jgi:hypothetical protein
VRELPPQGWARRLGAGIHAVVSIEKAAGTKCVPAADHQDYFFIALIFSYSLSAPISLA